MDFVDDIDFKMPVTRRKFYILTKRPDFVNAAVRSTVDFDNIKTWPWAISRQAGQFPQGESVEPSLQFKDFAKILAHEVFPTPRGPEKR